MINWERQPLYFAVIDGNDPRNWRPWEDEPQTFQSMCEDCQALISSLPLNDAEPKVSFEPLTEPLEQILASKRLHRVVGAIIDAKQDPNDLAFYEAKMAALERLCRAMVLASEPEQLLVKKAIDWFEIWFFIEGRGLEEWAHWKTRAIDIVNRCFGERPRVEWVGGSMLFPQQARRFLSDSRFSLLWGKR